MTAGMYVAFDNIRLDHGLDPSPFIRTGLSLKRRCVVIHDRGSRVILKLKSRLSPC